MKYSMNLLLLLLSVALFPTCKGKNTSSPKVAQHKEVQQVKDEKSDTAYRFNSPDNTFSLARDLQEISGLTYSPLFDKLLTINDEKGYIYFLNPNNAQIEGRIDFGRPEDYEGIAYYDGLIYVVESNGDINVVDEETENVVSTYKTSLSRKNDVEGICYNIETSTLLLAAKGSGALQTTDHTFRSIFELDPFNEKIKDKPYLKVNLVEEIENLASGNFNIGTNTSRLKKFAPSGIAVHPTSNHIYILSSKGKMLAIFDQKGALQELVYLDKSIHAQPEGICFGKNETLYISNEGRAGKGKILVFNKQNK